MGHYVPQRHLRRFEDPGRPGFIWMHDKQARPPAWSASIGNVAQARGFYPDETERALNVEVEIPGNNAIDKLIARKPIDPPERFAVARYIGAALKRTPFGRDWTMGLIPATHAEFFARLREGIRTLVDAGEVDPALAAGRLHLVDDMDERYARQLPDEIVATINDPMPTLAIVSAISGMTWRVVESTGPQFFITTDNPVFYFRWEGYGLGGPDTELCFPLCMRLALHASYAPAPGELVYLRALQKVVREINKRMISQLTRFAFYHEPAGWPYTLFAKGDLGSMRLGWS